MINFFSTKYYNNLKYNNKMISTTRIFFERTTKQQQTVANLGNVYRNSKWSDLKVQNIKTSFTNQFITVFVILTLIFFLYLFVFRFSISDINLFFVVPSKL